MRFQKTVNLTGALLLGLGLSLSPAAAQEPPAPHPLPLRLPHRRRNLQRQRLPPKVQIWCHHLVSRRRHPGPPGSKVPRPQQQPLQVLSSRSPPGSSRYRPALLQLPLRPGGFTRHFLLLPEHPRHVHPQVEHRSRLQ